MRGQLDTVEKASVSATDVAPTVNHAANMHSFWYAELAPVSLSALPAFQHVEVNENENSVIPMSTNLGSFAA